MEDKSSNESNKTVTGFRQYAVNSSTTRTNSDSPLVSKKSVIWRRTRSTPPEITDDISLGSRRNTARETTREEAETTWDRLGRSRKKSRFFANEFATRQPQGTARNRVVKDSIITIDVKLNYSLSEAEQPFPCDLSFALSEVYQRPASCIMVLVSTDVSILLHGTSDPAYYITIVALASEIAATKNKRSAHFIQQFMYEHLGIQPGRGVVKFDAVLEENLATNGCTALQEIERLTRTSTDDGSHPTFSYKKNESRNTTVRSSFDDTITLRRMSRTAPATPNFDPFFDSSSRSHSSKPRSKTHKKVKKRKSLMSFFGM